MSRYYWSKKEEADSLKNVNVSFLNKHGYFDNGWKSGNITWSRNGEKTGNISIQSTIDDDEQFVRFIYTQTDRYSGKKTDFDYKIPLTTTPCYFGGKRYWFTCPFYSHSLYCGKRVGVLYLGDKYFACRHCNNLTYNSRNLGGLSKTVGQVVSEPELEQLRQNVKRKYYAGKMTKPYKKYLTKERKAFFQLETIAYGLEAVYRKH